MCVSMTINQCHLKSEIDDRCYFLTEHRREYDLYDLAEGKIIKK